MPNETASATARMGITTSLRTTATLAAKLGRNIPLSCRPAPVTSRPIASEERPSASATSCQIHGSGMCVTLIARPIAQAQISGFLTTVIAMLPTDCFTGDA